MERGKRRSRGQWAQIVDEQERSGLSARAFCRRNSIGTGSFYLWRRRLRGDTVSRADGGAEEQKTFIDMGRIDSSGVELSAGEGPLVVTLALGAGVALTIRRG